MDNYKWSPKDKKWEIKNGKTIIKIALLSVAAIVLLIGVCTCFYTVDDKQQAVVTTFGKVTEITDAGPLFSGVQIVNRRS